MRLRQKLGYIALGIVITLIGVSIPIQSQNPSEFTDLVVETLTVKKMLWVEDKNDKITIAPEGILMRKGDNIVIGIAAGLMSFHDEKGASRLIISDKGIAFLNNEEIIASFSRLDPDNPNIIVLAREFWTTDHKGNALKSLD
jgi:hypothetical protein